MGRRSEILLKTANGAFISGRDKIYVIVNTNAADRKILDGELVSAPWTDNIGMADRSDFMLDRKSVV